MKLFHNKLKKIIIFSSRLSNVKYFLLDTLNVLSENYELFIITNKDIKIKKKKNINIINLNITRKPKIFLDIIYLLIILKHLILIRPNLVLTITPKISFIVSIAIIFFPVNKIHFFTGQIWYNKKNLNRYFFKQLDKIIFKTSNMCFVDSKSQIDFLVREGFSKSKLDLINNGSICGVDTNIFKKNSLYKKNFRKKYNIKKNEIVFMFLGRINREKGFFDLIHLHQLLKKNNVSSYFILIGEDEDNLTLRLKKDGNNNFIYIGHQSIPSNFLPCADLFVMLSQREGFGVSVIQASSCSLPIIGYNVVGLKDSILDNKTGILIDNIYRKKDSTRLLKLSKSRYLRSRFGNAGRKFVKKYFEKSDVINYLYEEINKYLI